MIMNIDEELTKAQTLRDGTVMSQERMDEVFGLVQNAENWKYEIDATVARGAATAEEVETAVCWFAGGLPEVEVQSDGSLRVYGAGYYAWVGC